MAEPVEPSHVGQDIFCEFLEVATHCILYNRKLYPATVFEKTKKYNVPVQMCLHPEVAKYVTDVMDSIRIVLKEHQLEHVDIVILNKNINPVERFVFEVIEPVKGGEPDRFLFELEQSLRSFLLKLNITDALLKSLPEDCTWTVQVTTKESAAVKMSDHQLDRSFPWIEADERESKMLNPKIVPLKSVTSNYMSMQLYVEESEIEKDYT